MSFRPSVSFIFFLTFARYAASVRFGRRVRQPGYITSVEEGDRSDGVGGFSELGCIVTLVAGQRVVNVASWTRGCKQHQLATRAFQFGQKKFRFDSIRFSLPNRFFRFDSIRQSDKFAACTLIFK